MKLTKKEILEEVATVAGDLDIALRRMTPEAALQESREAVEALRRLVHEQYPDLIFISGD